MQRPQPRRMPPNEAGQNRDGWKDAAPLQEAEAGTVCEFQIFPDWAVARVLGQVRGSDEAPLHQEMNARLQVGQIGHRDEQLATRSKDTSHFPKSRGLIVERHVLEDVEAEDAIERSVGIGQRGQRSATDTVGLVVGIEALDAEPVAKLIDQHAFSAAGVEDACGRRQLAQIPTDLLELGEVGGIKLPVWRELAVVIAPLCVFPRPGDGGRL